MFEHHFGLRENPFPAGHLLKFVYPSREHQEARAHLRYGIENREPFLLITGEVGTGKTTSLYDALNEWGDRVAVALITNSSLTRQEMLEEICLRFGLNTQPGISKPALLVMLERHLVAVRARGEHAVLMMDEAQNLSMDLLEEIRLLSNLEHRGEKLLQIFLVGQPELEAHLARHELRQLRQRITVHYRLNPLSADETLGYIHHHISVAGGNGAVVFPPESCREIFRVTHGIPREINTVASAALIAAYADSSSSVRMEHIATALQEGDFRSVLTSPSPRPAEPAPAPRAAEPAPAPRAAEPAPQPPAAAPPSYAQPPAPAPPPPAAAPAPPPLFSTGPPPPQPAMPGAPLLSPPPSAAPPPAASPYAPPPGPPLYAPPPAQPSYAPPPAASPYAPPSGPPSYAPAQPAAASWSAPPAEPPRPAPSELPKGLLAAMRRAEIPAPPPPPAMRRSSYATSVPASPPPPIPIRAEPAQRYAGPATRGTRDARMQDDVDMQLRAEDFANPMVRTGLIVVSVLATIGIMLVLMQRFGAIDVPVLRGAAGTHAVQETPNGPEGALLTPPTPDPTAALIDSLKREVETAKKSARVQPASASPAMPTASPRPRVTPPEPNSGTNIEGTSSGTAPSSPAPATATTSGSEGSETGFGIGVVSYLDGERARVESTRLAAETALPTVVMPYRDAGTTMYRVVIGRWATVADAEMNANALMERGVINEARVVTVPR